MSLRWTYNGFEALACNGFTADDRHVATVWIEPNQYRVQVRSIPSPIMCENFLLTKALDVTMDTAKAMAQARWEELVAEHFAKLLEHGVKPRWDL
jgi:hypothetical protein